MNAQKNFKQMQSELDETLSKLQSSELDIDKALELYKQGTKQIAELEKYLANAKNEVQKITASK